jgi:hypothetical protein
MFRISTFLDINWWNYGIKHWSLEYVASIEESRNSYRILGWKSLVKRQLEVGEIVYNSKTKVMRIHGRLKWFKIVW